MRWIDGLSKPQRVVVVVALGLALETAGSYVVSLGSPLASGWYAFSPLTNATYPLNGGLHSWLRVIIWLVLIGVWALASVKVMGPSSKDAPPK